MGTEEGLTSFSKIKSCYAGVVEKSYGLFYWQHGILAERLRELTELYFNPKSCLYHYLHMAEGNYETYLQGEKVRVKKYFYVLRPILACDWIRETNSMAPMEFQKLLDSQVTDTGVENEIRNLLNRKVSGEELDEEPRIQVLNNFLEQKIQFYNEYIRRLRPHSQPDTVKLNEVFRQTLEEAWK